MTLSPRVCIAPLFLVLVGCLKVTGEARDQFDLEDQEGSIDLIGGFKPSIAGNGEASSGTGEVTSQNVSRAAQEDADYDEFVKFQEWQRERDSDSAAYQEFQEYLEYKKWLRRQEAQ